MVGVGNMGNIVSSADLARRLRNVVPPISLPLWDDVRPDKTLMSRREEQTAVLICR